MRSQPYRPKRPARRGGAGGCAEGCGAAQSVERNTDNDKNKAKCTAPFRSGPHLVPASVAPAQLQQQRGPGTCTADCAGRCGLCILPILHDMESIGGAGRAEQGRPALPR